MKRAPAQYARSFQFAETDADDVTYFVLHQLQLLGEAIRDLEDHVRRKSSRTRSLEKKLRGGSVLNHRQKALLTHALRNPEARYTIASHRNSHGVVYKTARSDLLELHGRGLLLQTREGRRFVFHPVDRLVDAIEALGAGSSKSG